MHTRTLLALGTAAWLMVPHAGFAEEVGTDTLLAQATETTTGGNTADSDSTESTQDRNRGGGSVEHRRNDHAGPGSGGRSGGLSAGGNRSGPSGGGNDGGGSDSGGGDSGGDVD